MSNKKTIIQYMSFTFLFIYLLATSPVFTACGEDVIAFGGYVSSDEIETGSEVTFYGSFKNNWTGELTVNAFHVLFTDASTDYDLKNSTYDVTYPADRSTVEMNSSFTAFEILTIEEVAGTYNVSIYFTVTYGSNNADVYSLRNQTLEITKIYEAPKIAFYAVIVLFVLLMGLMVYSLINRFRW